MGEPKIQPTIVSSDPKKKIVMSLLMPFVSFVSCVCQVVRFFLLCHLSPFFVPTRIFLDIIPFSEDYKADIEGDNAKDHFVAATVHRLVICSIDLSCVRLK
jgi:hypothetical protein